MNKLPNVVYVSTTFISESGNHGHWNVKQSQLSKKYYSKDLIEEFKKRINEEAENHAPPVAHYDSVILSTLEFCINKIDEVLKDE